MSEYAIPNMETVHREVKENALQPLTIIASGLAIFALYTLIPSIASADAYRVNDWSVRNRGPIADLPASCVMENWKDGYGLSVTSFMFDEPSIHFSIKKERGMLGAISDRYTDKYSWQTIATGVVTDIRFAIDSRTYDVTMQRENDSEYFNLSVYIDAGGKLSDYTSEKSVLEYIARSRKIEIKINNEIIHSLFDANTFVVSDPDNKVTLASLFVKGTREAYSFFQRCIANRAKL